MRRYKFGVIILAVLFGMAFIASIPALFERESQPTEVINNG